MACTPGSIAAERLRAPLPRGSDTPVPGPLLLSPPTGTFWSCCVPVRRGGSTRPPGASPSKGPDRREGRLVPPRPSTCHTVRYNRNVCVPLTLERQSVNVLTCEFAHQIRGSETGRRVLWGERRGATKSPTVQVGPPNGNNTTSPRTTPRHGTQPTKPPAGETPRTNTRPNPSNQREPQPRPQVENKPDQNTTRKTSHPPDQPTPPEKNRNPQDSHRRTACTAQQRDDPNHEPQRTKQVGAGVKEGSKGSGPPHVTTPANQAPPPTNRTPPPTRHPDPGTRPRPETGHRNQDPHHPPTTPPPTPHQVPCTHAMDHQQPTPTPANELEQTPQTSPRRSELQMRRPGPGHHPTTHQQGDDGRAPPVAPPSMRHARNRRRPHQRRRQPRTKQPPSPVARLPHGQDHAREHDRQGAHTRRSRTRTAAAPMRTRNTNKQKRKTKQKKSENKRKRNPNRNAATRNLELKKNRAEKNEAAPWHLLPSPRPRKTGGDSNQGVACPVRRRLG